MLTAGNARFMAGEREHPNQDVGIRHRIANKQQPFAIFFGCADSRVAAEIIFDQGLGDLFVVRTAGHVVDSSVLGSICLLYTSPSPRDGLLSRMPSSA